jgi:cell division protease FtsH
LGNISYYDSKGGNDYGFTKPYSEKTAEVIDEEVSKLIESQYERAKQILTENKTLLINLAERLMAKEVIFKDDLEEILGVRPYISREEEIARLNSNQPKEENEVPTEAPEDHPITESTEPIKE